MSKEIILFETEDREVSLQVQMQDETVWLTRNQMAELCLERLYSHNELSCVIRFIMTDAAIQECVALMMRFAWEEEV